MTGAEVGEALSDRVVLKGTQRAAIVGALWFGTYAALYALFRWEIYIPLSFVIWSINRSPALGRGVHALLVAFAAGLSLALAVLAKAYPANPAVMAAVFVAFALAAILPFAVAPLGGLRLEIDGSGATLVDWWRKRTFLWSDYEIEIVRTHDGKVGGVGFSRELELPGKTTKQAQMLKKRENVFLSDRFGMKSEELAHLMKAYRARALGLPLDPGPYLSTSWQG